MPRCGPEATRAIGSAGSTSIDAQLRDHAEPERIRRRGAGARTSATCCCSAWAARASARKCLAETLGSAPGFPEAARSRFHRSAAGCELRAQDRSGAHAVHRVEQIRHDARAERADGVFLREERPTRSAPTTPARHFVAITDPGSQLEKLAKQRGFHRVFHGVPSIGGRYSVLSPFGIVPLAAMGRDVRAFLESARDHGALLRSRSAAGAESRRRAWARRSASLAQGGRDKVTIVASPALASFGAWAEQLLAEFDRQARQGRHPDRGRAARAIRRVYDGAPAVHLSARRRAGRSRAGRRRSMRCEQAGQPVVRIGARRSKEHLGQEFFRFEMATAVAGAVIGINPFDQPDVEASKVAARELTDAYEKTGSARRRKAGVQGKRHRALHRRAQRAGVAAGRRQLDAGELARRAFRAHSRRRLFRGPGLSRTQPTRTSAPLQELRTAVRD